MRKLSVYWYRTTDNFGDAFSPMAVAHCFGCKVVPGGKRDADLVAEGSVLDFALVPCGTEHMPYVRALTEACEKFAQ